MLRPHSAAAVSVGVHLHVVWRSVAACLGARMGDGGGDQGRKYLAFAAWLTW